MDNVKNVFRHQRQKRIINVKVITYRIVRADTLNIAHGKISTQDEDTKN